MNGSSTIVWRRYESAVDRLRVISNHLAVDKQVDTIGKIQIAQPRESGVGEVAKAIGEMISADMPKYIEAVIAKAQADVRDAAADLHAAIEADLDSKFMRAKHGG